MFIHASYNVHVTCRLAINDKLWYAKDGANNEVMDGCICCSKASAVRAPTQTAQHSLFVVGPSSQPSTLTLPKTDMGKLNQCNTGMLRKDYCGIKQFTLHVPSSSSWNSCIHKRSGQTTLERQDFVQPVCSDRKPKDDHSWSNRSIIMVLEHCVDMQGAGCWWGPGCNKWCLRGWCLKLRLSLLPSLHPQQHPSHHCCLHHSPLCQWVSGWAPGTYPCAPHGPAPTGYANQC